MDSQVTATERADRPSFKPINQLINSQVTDTVVVVARPNHCPLALRPTFKGINQSINGFTGYSYRQG